MLVSSFEKPKNYLPLNQSDLMQLKLYGHEPEMIALLQTAQNHDPYIVGRAMKAAKPSGLNDTAAWDKIACSLQDFGQKRLEHSDIMLGWYKQWLDECYPEIAARDYDGHDFQTMFGDDSRFDGMLMLDLT
jgi:hypothetical protein